MFEIPKREKFRHRIVELKGQGMTLEQIAGQLDEPISERVISNALKLHEQMESLGITDPFVVQMSPPDDLKKLRRHRHPRYSFSMADDYQRPEL